MTGFLLTIGNGERAEPAGSAGRRFLFDRILVAIDETLSRQLDTILHHPRFQKLEGSWRGLAWLVQGLEPGARGRIRVLSASWSELGRDLDQAIEFDQSHMFRSIYENEFGHAGGEPFSLLVVDQEITHRPRPREPGGVAPIDDLAVLRGLSAIATAAFAPVVIGAAATLFGVDEFEELSLSTDLLRLFGGEDHRRWRTLAGQENSRFVSVALSRLLARPQWRRSDIQHNGFRYEERVRGASDRPWFAASYAFASCVLRAFQDNAWPANVRGVTTDRIEGGLVVGVPQDPFRPGPDTAYDRSPLALSLSEAQERGLVEAGLMPLNSLPHGDQAFSAARSLQTEWRAAPGRPMTPFLANQRLSAQFNAVLAVSRFAHYVKMIAREMLGSMVASEQIESRLRTWLFRHVNSNVDSSYEMQIRYPLRSAQVSVHEIAGRPGSFGCIIHLQPHLQLDGVTTTFRLVTNFVA